MKVFTISSEQPQVAVQLSTVHYQLSTAIRFPAQIQDGERGINYLLLIMKLSTVRRY